MLRTVEEYKQSLRDGRVVYYRGERVPDVTSHPVIGVAVEHAAIDYRMAEDPAHRDLAVTTWPGTAEPISRYYAVPKTSDDLLKRSALIAKSTEIGATLVVLIKEIGTDALFGLHIIAKHMDDALGTQYLPRVRAFHEHCARKDLAVAVAQTDVKGDRSLGPAEQADPDFYVHIVDERPDGIVVRGAKVHTSVSTNANEIIVLPTRAMGAEDRAYAVAFAVPANAQGLRMVASPYGGHKKSAFEHPISAKHKMMETLTIFEDVFVPNERVFLKGEWQYAGPLAKTFVEFHRFTAVSYKLPLLDLLIGAAQLMVEYNGIERAGHVREKMSWLIAYAETVRALTRLAALDYKMVEPEIAAPNTFLVNMAKLHFANGYHQALMHVQDITGGLIVTGPGEEDLRNPETGDVIRRLLGGKKGVGGEDRLRAINLVQDLTAGDFGGYQAVLAIHAEGSIEAEKLTMYREFDLARVKAYAKQIAGIGK